MALPSWAQNPSSPTTGELNGHEWVDLGLSVKWATCNVGASKPDGLGKYYAWGETKPRSKRDLSEGVEYKEGMENISGDPLYDAARANWGATWRIPTMGEWNELKENCMWEWITKGSRKGVKITGPNGNHIFLPAIILRFELSVYSSASCNFFSPYPDIPRLVMEFYFNEEEGIVEFAENSHFGCNSPLPIRAVCD